MLGPVTLSPVNPSLRLKTMFRDLAVRSPLRGHVLHQYPYFFTPAMLWELCAAVDRVRDVPGSFLEIGCARGHTTVYLNRHMDASGQPTRRYVCIDTFAGFVDSDVDHEVERRGKAEHDETFRTSFTVNSKAGFETTMRLNGCTRVEAVQADVRAVDWAQYSPVAFALVDVDLYLPVRDALTDIVDHMSPGGVIVVDDCAAENRWDGGARGLPRSARQVGPAP